ncbi:MAG: tRNA 2-thiouridine(34) synthase MnmA [Alphaproteobacteria bacterium]
MNSLGIDKDPADTRVVVAMSGGVDSSVTAARLHREGYDVLGVTLQLYDHGEAIGRKGACCAGQDIYDARRVADRLDMPHYVLDYESRFRAEVIDEFADAYVRGETPIPCVVCNRTVKFRDLLTTAHDLEADALATGHYVRRVVGEEGVELHRAADRSRDQSYFLFGTTPEQLAFLRFPLGGMAKDEVRAMGRELGLVNADKPDSQDICFVPNGNYARLVEKLRPGAAEPGEVVHVDGEVLGTHPGIVHYTVGQRRGLGLGARRANGGDAEPLYVVRLDPELRRVVVGPKSALAVHRVLAGEVNWLTGAVPETGLEVEVKLRSTQPPAPATVHGEAGGRARIELHAPQFGIAPGQAAVFYRGDRVLGGGWILREARALAA